MYLVGRSQPRRVYTIQQWIFHSDLGNQEPLACGLIAFSRVGIGDVLRISKQIVSIFRGDLFQFCFYLLSKDVVALGT